MQVPTRFIGLLLGIAVSWSTTAWAQDATKVLERANKAMGIDGLKTLRYTAEGIGQTFGQAYDTQSAWPKITVHSQVRTIDYASGSMREEFTLSRAEPQGGGGYPITGQQKNETFVSGNYAWNVAGGNPVPMSRSVLDRTHQMWVTPHGALIAAARNKATVSYRKVGEKSLPALSFVEPSRFRAVVYLDAEHQVERIESRLPDPVLGETTAVTRFSGYQSHGAVRFPGRIQQSQGGHQVLDVTVKEVAANGPAEIAIPEPIRNATERVTTDKVAEGVWFIGGGSHNSVAIEMKDYLVLVESPLFDGRALPVIDAVKALAPGKPIRYMVNSHNHFDHAGGVRTAVASGATIVTHAGNKAFFERTTAAQSRIAPDALSKSGRKAKFVIVNEKHVMKDATRSIELHRIADSNHAHNFLMVYLPAEKLLVEADAFTPGPAGAAPPATPNPNNVNLVDNIERLKLRVDRILPLHGRMVPVADLYTATGRKPAE